MRKLWAILVLSLFSVAGSTETEDSITAEVMTWVYEPCSSAAVTFAADSMFASGAASQREGMIAALLLLYEPAARAEASEFKSLPPVLRRHAYAGKLKGCIDRNWQSFQEAQ